MPELPVTTSTIRLRMAAPPNRSVEELAMRDAVCTWGLKRWPDARVIDELILGDRRIDLVFVTEKDIVGVEIKSSLDRLHRLSAQMREFRLWLPEIWIAAAPRWETSVRRLAQGNWLTVAHDRVVAEPALNSIGKAAPAFRDDLICSRLIALLNQEEAERVARRKAIVLPAARSLTPEYALRAMLARLLTGNEIMREVCCELRARTEIAPAGEE